MYTSKPIHLLESTIPIENHEVSDYIRDYCGDIGFIVTILPNAAVYELHLSDYTQYIKKESLFNEDRSLRTFLEMAITQFSLNRNIYTQVGAGKLFETSPDHAEEVANGIVLRTGVAKGVRIVQVRIESA